MDQRDTSLEQDEDGALQAACGACMSRRALLAQAGAGLALYAAGPAPAFAAGAQNSGLFMKASSYLIQHRLSPELGKRMEESLSKKVEGLDAILEAIVKAAESKKAKMVEDFFDDLPQGKTKETALKIIHGWYAGVWDDAPAAEVFAFEQALMYQPAKDAATIPTYAFGAPNKWVGINPPVDVLPDF